MGQTALSVLLKVLNSVPLHSLAQKKKADITNATCNVLFAERCYCINH